MNPEQEQLAREQRHVDILTEATGRNTWLDRLVQAKLRELAGRA